jgi:hypothetical protein
MKFLFIRNHDDVISSLLPGIFGFKFKLITLSVAVKINEKNERNPVPSLSHTHTQWQEDWPSLLDCMP